MSEMRRVTAICNGTVIDHIPAGHALQVIRMLRIDKQVKSHFPGHECAK